MSFANTDSTPDKKGIVEKAGVFDNALGSGKGKVIGVANNQIFEGVFGVKTAGVLGLMDRGGKERGGGGIAGFSGDRFLDNKFKIVVLFGLIVEGGFEVVVMAFFVHFDQIRIGTGNDGFVVLIGDELSFGDKGLVDSGG